MTTIFTFPARPFLACELSAEDRADIRRQAAFNSLEGYAELPMWAAVRGAS